MADTTYKVKLIQGFPAAQRIRAGIEITREYSYEGPLTSDQLDEINDDPYFEVEEVVDQAAIDAEQAKADADAKAAADKATAEAKAKADAEAKKKTDEATAKAKADADTKV